MDQQIKEIINSEIRPYIQADGGDVEFIEFNQKTGIVTLRLHGACAGCPISHVTLYQGVEKLLKEKIPQVKGVQNLD